MSGNRIHDLGIRCIEMQRVDEALVRALSEAVEDGGFITRAEAETLMRIERTVAAPCEDWRDFFVATLTAHLVWETRPTGVVDAEACEWLAAQLAQPRPGAAASIAPLLMALVREADRSDPRLMRLALTENREDPLSVPAPAGAPPSRRAA